ncbi:hypothetical protein B4U80_14197 [Leptotrombidium deliense]|uniref:Uncharacterized protein n=1 Tax=Leptotrombidium deliense TaxID=299467 RepID=A0A443S0E1_9ACAR|nr:hypothetical protein B4U80_14197 [Leptotrombidium deliense]
MKVCFKNPLNETLKDIRIAVEGKGIDRKVFKISDVNALSMSNTVIRLSSKYLGLETIVVNVFNPIIKDTITNVVVNVSRQKKHLLANRYNGKKMNSNETFVAFAGYDKLRK